MPAANRFHGTSFKLRIKTLALFTGMALLGTLLGVWLAFPVGPVTGYLMNEAGRQGILIEATGLKRGWPLAIEASSARIASRALQGQVLALRNIRIAPSVSSLFAVTLAADVWEGRLNADIDRDLNSRVRLTQARIPEELTRTLPVKLTGRIARLDFTGRLPLQGANQSLFELILDELAITGTKALGASSDSVSLGTVRARVEGTGNRLKLSQLSGNGVLRLAGSGTVLLGRTPATTRLNLQLTLQPTPSLDPGLKDLLSLLGKPAADGRVILRISGTLAKPRTG